MNYGNPSFLERVAGAVLRWAAEQHRRADDEKYWQAAQHDPRLMADITCAVARAEGDARALAGRRPAPTWAELSPLMAVRDVIAH